ncbi:hypothetical protein HT118_03315 [Escherichia coli]|nr:hypothetical protein [Escherichia coli]
MKRTSKSPPLVVLQMLNPGAEEMPPLSDEDMIPVTEEEGAEGSYY